MSFYLFSVFRCIILTAVFMLYMDNVKVPLTTGCVKRKAEKKMVRIPVFRMFPVRIYSHILVIGMLLDPLFTTRPITYLHRTSSV